MILNFGEGHNRFCDNCAFMATGTTFFRKTVFGRNYRFSGETSPVIKLSIKSKKNDNVNVLSRKTSCWDKDGEMNFRFKALSHCKLTAYTHFAQIGES